MGSALQRVVLQLEVASLTEGAYPLDASEGKYVDEDEVEYGNKEQLLPTIPAEWYWRRAEKQKVKLISSKIWCYAHLIFLSKLLTALEGILR